MSLDIEKEAKPPIYSKAAIIGFCVFFSPIFGGFMLRQNLKDIGKIKEGNLALGVSLLMTIITGLISTTSLRGPGTTFVANFIQAAILSEFIFRNYFQNEETFPKKSIRKPLLNSLFVLLVLITITMLIGVPPEAL
ncbi:MAG: hypothetical protein K9H61_02145 [Bacteroidia bacterium]|nr:hypothetical protein [Bacteroidia bacterium]MCF8426329.1 hypothetical protein [Bacteroidia bacterium]MCF8445772.1 hypothetical protein [Bacteroidia bacterium]